MWVLEVFNLVLKYLTSHPDLCRCCHSLSIVKLRVIYLFLCIEPLWIMSLSVNSSFNTCMYVRIHVLLNYCLPRGQGSRSIILSVLSFVWLSIFYVSIGSVSCEINPFYSYISSSSRLQPPLGLSFSHVTDFRPISCVHSVSPWVLTRLALSFTPAAFFTSSTTAKEPP